MSAAALGSALYEGRVHHRRVRPREHRLAYSIVMMLIDLDEVDRLDRSLKLFSADRFNLMSFRGVDHLSGGGDGSGGLKREIQAILADHGFATGGRVRLLCMPRVLGAAFNPLSVYFCDTPDGQLQAILYEVNNTFGQRHSYLLPAAGEAVDQVCEKVFYVSPFNTLQMRYRFRITPPAREDVGAPLRVAITVETEQGLLLTASFSGRRQILDDPALARAWLRHPVLGAKVVGAIHWEALKLFLKGVRLTRRPAPPAMSVTFTPAGLAAAVGPVAPVGHRAQTLI